MKNYEVAIIGGGINGCAIAYELANKGTKVIVLEKEYLASGATGRCGGGIRQQWATKENIKLAHESVKIFEKLSKELGYDIEYEQGGYLVLAHSRKELETFEENVKLQRSLGLKVRVLGRSEIADIVPFIDVEGARAVGATYCATDGHANPFKTTYGYAKKAKELGACFKTFTEVKKIEKEEDNFKLITTNDRIRAEKVVNAAGEYSPSIAKSLGLKIPITPYRHEILATEPLEPILKPMIISFTDGIYFCQHKTGQIVGGIGNPSEKPGINLTSSLEFIKRMASVITRYIPTFKHLCVLRQWAGHYDVTPDARPILGEPEKIKNFINVCGFSGHGFMLAPAVAKHISELILYNKISDLIKELSLERFKGKVLKERAVVG